RFTTNPALKPFLPPKKPFLPPKKPFLVPKKPKSKSFFSETELQKMAIMGEVWTNIGSAVASLVFIYTIFERFFPYHLRENLEPLVQRFINLFYPYIQIKFFEYSGERFERNDDYATIQNYLSKDSSSRAKKLRANTSKGSKSIVLSMDDHEEITDEFKGVKVWWQSKKHQTDSRSISYFPKTEESRFYILKFHVRDRHVITNRYLDHIRKEGKKMEVKNRERKLYSNNPSQNWSGYNQTKWSHVTFEHPATFDTLAMENEKKEEIKNDLTKFSNSQDYYKRIGKAWKRGYLLHGPPGTGKSTMVAAMANFLDYDVYDLELTTVKDNTELRRLLIETSGKSIIVIEDIDCSLDLAACGGERIIVFTTNFIDKLDPALIRKGRMDKHIEMSYCGFEAFKVLARNYLYAEEEEHEAKETCLKRLIVALKEEKEEAKKRVEEEEKKKEKEKDIKRKRRDDQREKKEDI
ncbi:hypothetical protein HID58_002282, partial [Brassica napus]